MISIFRRADLGPSADEARAILDRLSSLSADEKARLAELGSRPEREKAHRWMAAYSVHRSGRADEIAAAFRLLPRSLRGPARDEAKCLVVAAVTVGVIHGTTRRLLVDRELEAFAEGLE